MSAATRLRLGEVLAGARPDLAEIGALIGAEADPEVEVPAVLRQVDALAGVAEDRGGGVAGVVAALSEEGFHGDRDEYDRPDNCLLPEVMRRRVGMPIALSSLAIAVGDRIDAPVAGLGLPGHFVIADLGREPSPIIDPFNRWAPIDRERCAELARLAGEELRPEHLEPAGARAIVRRTLLNLKASYMRRRLLDDALWTVELTRLIDPDDPSPAREASVLLAALGRYDEAEAAAAAYLLDRPDAPDRPAVERHRDAVRDLRRGLT